MDPDFHKLFDKYPPKQMHHSALPTPNNRLPGIGYRYAAEVLLGKCIIGIRSQDFVGVTLPQSSYRQSTFLQFLNWLLPSILDLSSLQNWSTANTKWTIQLNSEFIKSSKSCAYQNLFWPIPQAIGKLLALLYFDASTNKSFRPSASFANFKPHWIFGLVTNNLNGTLIRSKPHNA